MNDSWVVVGLFWPCLLFLHFYRIQEDFRFTWNLTYTFFNVDLRFMTLCILKKKVFQILTSYSCHCHCRCLWTNNSRKNHQIKMHFGTIYRGLKRKDEFINHPFPIKISKIRALYFFLIGLRNLHQLLPWFGRTLLIAKCTEPRKSPKTVRILIRVYRGF